MRLRWNLWISFAILLLVACTPRGTATPAQPFATSAVTSPPVTPSLPHFTATTDGMQQPSPTSLPLAFVLADFPLSPGTVWVYSAEISYGDPKDYTQTITWTGTVIDTVIDQKGTAQDTGIIFTLQEALTPTPPQDVWRQSTTFEYAVAENALTNRSVRILQWPIFDGATWPAFPSAPSSGYVVRARYIGGVDVPYGHVNDCYSLLLVTLPDITRDTFCRGIGLVEHSYQHFGTPQTENFRLIKFRPGQIVF